MDLKFILKQSKLNLHGVSLILRDDLCPYNISTYRLNKIFKRASEDILFGKYIFNTCLLEDINKYNRNWHMSVGYSVDDFLFNLYIQEQIYSLCKGKFNYESNVYSENNWYKTLDLKNDLEHKLLYKKMVELLIITSIMLRLIHVYDTAKWFLPISQNMN